MKNIATTMIYKEKKHHLVQRRFVYKSFQSAIFDDISFRLNH